MKKERKVPQGPVRDKAKTKDKLLKAVGNILQKKGFSALNGLRISQEAKLDRKLIYEYFGSVDNLIESYIRDKDFWTP